MVELPLYFILKHRRKPVVHLIKSAYTRRTDDSPMYTAYCGYPAAENEIDILDEVTYRVCPRCQWGAERTLERQRKRIDGFIDTRELKQKAYKERQRQEMYKGKVKA